VENIVVWVFSHGGRRKAERASPITGKGKESSASKRNDPHHIASFAREK